MVRCFALLLLLPLGLNATQLMPWFGRDKEIEIRGGMTYQTYKRLDSTRMPSDDVLIDLGLAVSPVSRWNAEAELAVIHSAAQDFGFDSMKLTGRYLAMNDIIGDPLSLALGMTLCLAPNSTVKDPSTWHAGKFDTELHVSIGREFQSRSSWWLRMWLLNAFGWAFEHSPWWRSELAAEFNIDESHLVKLFGVQRMGFGDGKLPTSFSGYGPLAYRALDIGLRYTYLFRYNGSLSFELTQRVWAAKAPENATQLRVEYMYPFGL